MKKYALWLVTAACFASAQIGWTAGGSKIAVFDVQEAIMSTTLAKEKMKAFESRSDIAKMIKDAEKLKQEIISLQQGAGKDASKAKDVEFKRADYELIVRKLNSEKQAAGKALIDEIAPKLEGVVKQIIEADGIALLLDKKAAIHVDAGLDITSEVTKRLNGGK